MSTTFLVFGLVFICCSIILLSRQNMKRSFRQRKMHAVLARVRQLTSQ